MNMSLNDIRIAAKELMRDYQVPEQNRQALEAHIIRLTLSYKKK